MSNICLCQEIYDLATQLWYLGASDPMRRRGHPGVPGPEGGIAGVDYDHSQALLEGARTTLKQAVESAKRED